jgi:hypothetical protein
VSPGPMVGGGGGRVGGRVLDGFTRGNLFKTHPTSSQIPTQNRKSIEIPALCGLFVLCTLCALDFSSTSCRTVPTWPLSPYPEAPTCASTVRRGLSSSASGGGLGCSKVRNNPELPGIPGGCSGRTGWGSAEHQVFLNNQNPESP